jgi:glycosyltransferase involved in cell wall biosynthesis
MDSLMNVLVMCSAIVGTRMASPGIRSSNIARVLKQQLPDAKVTLALPPKLPSDLDPASVEFNVEWPDQRRMIELIREHDVIVTAKFPLKYMPFALNKKIVLDLYTPFYTEWMEMSKNDPSAKHRRAWLESKRKNLLAQMAAADLILCANDRQRDLLIGIMGTLGYFTARAYDDDPTLERLVRVAPLGIRPNEPQPGAPIMKGVMPGIAESDFVLLFNGTIVEWYDLDLLVHAVHRLSRERSDIKLVFMGTEHPDSFGAKPLQGLGGGATKHAMALAEQLGILGTHIFFNFGWANADETERYLQEADASVCTYWDSLETRYSFRVRYLDVFWARLPIICTRGDVVSEWVDEYPLGVAIPEGDLDGLTDAIRRLADDREFRERCRANLGELREQFRWERTLAPLVEFCRTDSAVLTRRREQVLPLVTHSLDWLVSQSYYNARWTVVNPLMNRLGLNRGKH